MEILHPPSPPLAYPPLRPTGKRRGGPRAWARGGRAPCPGPSGPAVEQPLDGGEVRARDQLDGVQARGAGLRRRGPDAVAAEVFVQRGRPVGGGLDVMHLAGGGDRQPGLAGAASGHRVSFARGARGGGPKRRGQGLSRRACRGGTRPYQTTPGRACQTDCPAGWLQRRRITRPLARQLVWPAGREAEGATVPRLTYFTGLALLLLAGAFLLTDRLTRRPGVTEANAKRIQVGMTLADVEALLGGRSDESGFGTNGEHDWRWDWGHGSDGTAAVCVALPPGAATTATGDVRKRTPTSVGSDAPPGTVQHVGWQQTSRGFGPWRAPASEPSRWLAGD